MQSLAGQVQQSQVAHLDGVQRHEAAVDCQVGNSLVVNEFGQILQAKLVDSRAFEIDLLIQRTIEVLKSFTF